MSERAAILGIAVGATLAAAGCGNAGGSGAHEWETFSTQRQVAGEEHFTADVEYAAGRFSVAPVDDATLYNVDMRYDANVYRPASTYEDGRLRLRLEGGGSVRGRNLGDGHLRLGINPLVVTDLDLKFGAVMAELELGGLSLRRLTVQTGASETRLAVSAPNRIEAERVRIEAGAARFNAQQLGNLNVQTLHLSGGIGDITLDFSGGWQADMTATIDMGVGSLNLSFPRGLGVRINRSGVLSGFDGQELVRRGNVYYSENWESAPRKLDITMNAAVGRVRVSWVDAPIS